MKFKVSEDKNFLIIDDSTQLEIEQIESSFTKKLENWYIMKKKRPGWDCEIHFVDRYNRIPLGLWGEVVKFCKKYNFPIIIEGGYEILTDKNFKEDDFDNWLDEFFPNPDIFYPREYQIESAKRALKYRICTQEIATAGGKTIIAYTIFRYLLDRGLIKNMLYVVPNIGLIGQTEEKFYIYEEKAEHKPQWKSQCVFSGASKKLEKDPDIVFGTYQSLVKRGVDYFKEFDSVIIDECLHPDTLIIMEDLSKKKISEIKIGEKVWTKNITSGKNEIKEISFIYKNLSKNQQMYEIEMEDNTIIKITGNHKVLLETNKWKRVDELNEEDKIVKIDE
jgi:hypothetical protein